jgi:hypothetical protein
MPFRYAHWMLVALAPVIALAFWPAYFGDLANASFAFHAHGLTASAWLLLVAVQSWTVHRRQLHLHRAAGLALFAAVPLFAAAAVLAMHGMATKYALRSDPFYAVLGPRLGAHDILSTIALVGLVCAALAWRRKVTLHAACMLSTVLLVLPPVIARLPVPRIPHSGELVAIALAVLIAWREPRGRGPLVAVAAILLVHVVMFETVAATAGWAAIFARFSTLPVGPFALAAGLASLLALLIAWRSAAPRARRSPAMPVSATGGIA